MPTSRRLHTLNCNLLIHNILRRLKQNSLRNDDVAMKQRFRSGFESQILVEKPFASKISARLLVLPLGNVRGRVGFDTALVNSNTAVV